MKDYTVSHRCGYESGTHMTLIEAKADAIKHQRKCSIPNVNEADWIGIDEFDKDEGELTGTYWWLKGKRFTKVQ